MKKSKICSVILSSIMFFQSGFVMAEKNETIDSENISIFQDFSVDTKGLKTSGALKRVTQNDGNSVLAFPTTGVGNSYIGEIYNEPLDGRFVFSYDYFTEHGKNITDMWIYTNNAQGISSDKDVYQVSHWQLNGFFQTHRTTSWEFDTHIDYNYESGKWYHCETWVDTINREIAIYVDDDLVVRMEIPDEVKTVRGFGLRMITCATEGYAYLDNMQIKKMDDGDSGRENPFYIKTTAPEGVYGNNFTKDSLPSFNAEIVNRLNKRIEASMYYKVLTTTGKEIWNTKENPESIVLEANETARKKIKIEKEYFGRLDLEIVTVIEGKEYIKRVPYTFINRTLDMPKNERFGVANHLNKGRGDFDNVLYALQASGIGSYRDALVEWRKIEKQKGILNFTDEMKYQLEALEKNDIWFIEAITYGNYPLYNDPVIEAGGAGWGYLFPTTKEGLKAIENWATAAVNVVPGAIDAFGVWNEYQNMSGPAFRGNYEYLANLHKAIYRGAKKANPDVLVSGMESDRWGMYDWDDVNKVLSYGEDEPVFDAISIHTYSPNQVQPEKGIGRQYKKDVVSLFEKYGVNPDMDVNVTEIGWSETHVNYDRELLAAYTIRNQAWHWAYDVGDRICNYNLNDYPEFNSRSSMQEARFGLMESYNKRGCEIPYLGKESFVAAGYYNNLLADGEFIDFVNTGYTEERAYGYRFRHRDGSDVLMLGPIENETLNFNLHLGTNSVIVGDKYGNEKEVFGIDGNFNFVVDGNDILYLRGNFDQIKPGRELFNISDLSLDVPMNYDFSIVINAPMNFEGEIKAKTVNLATLDGNGKISEGVGMINLKSSGQFYDGAEVYIEVLDDEGRLCYFYTIPVSYTTSGQIKNVRWRPVGSRTDLWDLHLEIENIRADKPISGTVETKGFSYVIPEIAPKELRKIIIPAAEIKTTEELGKFYGTIKITTGEEIPIELNETMTGMVYAKEKPVIDGKISDGEWDVGVMALRLDSKNQVYGSSLDKWSGPDDASMDVYLKYDNENFYVAARVKDNIYRQVNPFDSMWNGDSLQVLIGFDKADSGTQYGIGLADGKTPTIYRNTQEDNMGGLGGADAAGVYTDGEVGITTEGVYTVYEASFPWDKIKFGGGQIIPGQRIAFSILYNDDDGNNRENWIEYANNCIGGGSNSNAKAVSTLLIPNVK